MTNKGQAMIEALVVGAVLMASLSFSLRYGLAMLNNLLVDEFIEQSLLCEAEGLLNCNETLRSLLEKLQFRNIKIHTLNEKNKFKIFINGTSSFDQKLEKESELDLELSYMP